MIRYKNGILKNYQWNIERIRNHHKGHKDKVFNHSIITFDIETTSAWIDENGDVIGYRKGLSEDYWNSLEHLSLCYIWQCSIDGTVYYGRELREFKRFLSEIPDEAKAIIWVHNLAFEFQFLSNILKWSDVFARSPHKPIKASCVEYPNIEFRCSYTLTGLSLETWGSQIGIPKLVGFLDYEKVRTPKTKLTKNELDYSERDCIVVDKGIRDYVKRYGTLFKIPLTQTGTVRQEVKDRLYDNIPNYRNYIIRLLPKSAHEYKLLQAVFSGGYTHANRYYSGHIIKDEIIEHYDFSSSYPTVLVAFKYPSTPWVYVGKNLPDIKTFDDYAYILVLTFEEIESTSFNTYIQASKCKGKGFKYDNGRVISADWLTITITEQDFITIKNNYEWKNLVVERVYRSYKKYLPTEFIKYILELYKNKTELKDLPNATEEDEQLYMRSKQYINSLYGMSVTALVNADVHYTSDGWYMDSLTEQMVNDRLNELRKWRPNDRRYFLSYSWGCWVTAYARRNLWSCIEPHDDDVIYCDTDSIFIRGKHDYSWYNDWITEELKKACEYHSIDFELTRPKTVKGVPNPLGIFTKEPDVSEFLTLGSKRYVERRVCDGMLHLTVSGINKGAVTLLNNDISNFKDGFIFDKDSDDVSKRMVKYLDNIPKVVYPDGYKSTYKHGINLRRTGYKLHMTDEYKNLIEYGEMTLDDLPDHYLIKLRSLF